MLRRFLVLSALALTALIPQPSPASPAAGVIVFQGTMNVSGTVNSGLPGTPSIPPPAPVGSGEDFPVSGGNETCGKNNSDGGVGSTHVPDPLVDEIGLCRGGPSLPSGLPGTNASWSMSVGSEPPALCRGTLFHDEPAGQVCTFSALGTFGGITGATGARCEIQSGSGSFFFEFQGVLGDSHQAILNLWFQATGVGFAQGPIVQVDGLEHGGSVTGFIQLIPEATCATAGSTRYTVLAELAFAGM